MLNAPITLAYAHARHHDLEREADHERLVRAARAALRACCGDVADESCCGDVADESCCAPGCCDEPGCCADDADHGAGSSTCGARDATRRPAGRPRAGGIAALVLRTVRSVWPTAGARCACAAA